MNAISIDDVKKLASLSALELSEQETLKMQADLTQILGYVEQLQAVNTDGVEPTYQAHSLNTVTRSDDIIDYGVAQDQLLKNAPKHDNGSVVVPRVLE